MLTKSVHGFKEVAAQERKVIAAEEHVPNICLPTIGFDVIFFIISLFWPKFTNLTNKIVRKELHSLLRKQMNN